MQKLGATLELVWLRFASYVLSLDELEKGCDKAFITKTVLKQNSALFAGPSRRSWIKGKGGKKGLLD